MRMELCIGKINRTFMKVSPPPYWPLGILSLLEREPNKDQVAAPQPVAEPLEDAKRFFSPIPVLAESKDNPVTPQKVA